MTLTGTSTQQVARFSFESYSIGTANLTFTVWDGPDAADSVELQLEVQGEWRSYRAWMPPRLRWVEELLDVGDAWNWLSVQIYMHGPEYRCSGSCLMLPRLGLTPMIPSLSLPPHLSAGQQSQVTVATSFPIRPANGTGALWQEGLQLPAAVPGSGSMDLLAGVGYLPAVQSMYSSLAKGYRWDLAIRAMLRGGEPHGPTLLLPPTCLDPGKVNIKQFLNPSFLSSLLQDHQPRRLLCLCAGHAAVCPGRIPPGSDADAGRQRLTGLLRCSRAAQRPDVRPAAVPADPVQRHAALTCRHRAQLLGVMARPHLVAQGPSRGGCAARVKGGGALLGGSLYTVPTLTSSLMSFLSATPPCPLRSPSAPTGPVC